MHRASLAMVHDFFSMQWISCTWPRTTTKTKMKHKAGKAEQQNQGKSNSGEQYALIAVDVSSRGGSLIPIDGLEAATMGGDSCENGDGGA